MNINYNCLRVLAQRTEVDQAQRASATKKKIDNFCRPNVESLSHRTFSAVLKTFCLDVVGKPRKQQKYFTSIAKLWCKMHLFCFGMNYVFCFDTKNE